LNLDYSTVFSLAPYISLFIFFILLSLIYTTPKFSVVYLNSGYLRTCNFNLITKNINSTPSCRLFSTYEELVEMSDEDFIEWFRGISDGESTFYIKSKNNDKNFEFRFRIFMHIDEKPLLLFIQSRLGIGKIYTLKKSVEFNVSSQKEIIKIIEIFNHNPLNTTKHLNFLDFKKAFELYTNSVSKSSVELINQLNLIKNNMNRGKVDYTLMEKKEFKFTHYWVLGFIEGEGSFYVRNNEYFPLSFGLGQSAKDLALMKELRIYLAEVLPREYGGIAYPKAVSLVAAKDALGNVSSNTIIIGNTNYLKNVFIPFLDSMVWQSKKLLDYRDWKSILQIKELGLRKTESGVEVINLLINRMNLRRLTTNKEISAVNKEDLARKMSKLLNSQRSEED